MRIDRKGLRLVLGAALAAGAFAPVAGAVEVIPLYQLSLMGGQYFFSGSKSSLNGNARGNVAPALKFNDRWTLLPVYDVIYQGTKGVSDPVGSGTLFQQLMDHRVSVAGLYTPPGSKWRFKPSGSYKIEFLKETRDEAWGKGLFDYHKLGLGFEAENIYKEPFSYRIGYDLYFVRFPNYQSLESKSGVDPNGNPLGRETASKNVLDTINNQLSVSATRPFPYDSPKVSLQGAYSFNWQSFPDQKIVNQQGQFESNKRGDFLQSLSLGVVHPMPVSFFGDPYRLNSRFGLGLAYNSSNQNTFDATRAQFVPDSYSYFSWSLGPSATLAWGSEKQPAWTSLGLTFSRTQYMGRLTQDANGAYQSKHQHGNRTLLSLAYGYPIAANFNLKAQANFLWATSNHAFEATYRYTYRTANYLFGFQYDY